MDFTQVKIEVYAPKEYIVPLRDRLNNIGAGHLGNYDMCCAFYPVTGSWRPLAGSNPYNGEREKISTEAEYKLEMRCRREHLAEALEVIRSSHPYEEPLINVIPLLDENKSSF